MMFAPSRSRFAALALVGAAAAVSAPVRAQEDVINKVKDLNKRAIDAYENLELEEARKALTQALETCAAEGLNNHQVKALSHLNLGVIFVGGFKQKEQGVRQFRRALEIDPTIKIPKRLQNPEVGNAFDEAKAALGTGAPDAAALVPTGATDPGSNASNGEAPPAGLKGIHHRPISDSDPGATITVRAAVEGALAPARVILAYRADGASDFLLRDMDSDGQGWVTARIPQAATNGGSVAYYIEARDKAGRALANHGSSTEPHVVTLGSGTPEATTSGASGSDARRGALGLAGRIWVGLAVGAGGGYTKGRPEVNPSDFDNNPINFSGGFASAQLLHFAPEVGYALRDDLLVSVQGRLQVITGATKIRAAGCAPGGAEGFCEPATGAIAILGKATYLLSRLGPIRPTVGALVGGGEIRHLMDINSKVPNKCGDNGMSACFDTIVSRSFMVGPSVGLLFPLSDLLSLTANLNTLFILPKSTLNADLNLGVAASF